MIQRIQTLYLFVVSALMAVTLFVPLAWFAGDAGEFRLCAFALREVGGQAVQPTLYMGVLLAVACALPLVTLFLFRRRLLQFRLCVAEAVLLVGAAVMEGVYYFLSWRVFSGLTFHLQGVYVSIALPVVCLVFVWLAARAICTTSCSSALPTASVEGRFSPFRTGSFPRTGVFFARPVLFRYKKGGRNFVPK